MQGAGKSGAYAIAAQEAEIDMLRFQAAQREAQLAVLNEQVGRAEEKAAGDVMKLKRLIHEKDRFLAELTGRTGRRR